jgi:hypothetical protein
LTGRIEAPNLFAPQVTKRSNDPAPQPPGGRAAERLRMFREQRGLPGGSSAEQPQNAPKPERASQKKARPDEKKE